MSLFETDFSIHLKKSRVFFNKKLIWTPRRYTCERGRGEPGGFEGDEGREAEGQKWGRAGDAVSVSTLRNEGSRRNGPITYSCAPKWFQPCNRPMRCGASRSYTRLWIKTSVCYPCGVPRRAAFHRPRFARPILHEARPTSEERRYFPTALPDMRIPGYARL